MATIRLETLIEAPRELVFDLARNVDAHVASAERTGERAVAGTARGPMQLADTVTFEARHFGIRWRMTSRIVQFDPPASFTDSMVRGPFARFVHRHELAEERGGTRMIDVLEFRSPLGPIGALVDRLAMAAHLRRFLETRNAWLKHEAESRAAPSTRGSSR